MFKNREKRPEIPGSEAKIEKEEIGKEEKESGEDILKKALEEIESGEEIRHLEDEAYEEKEERERYENAKREEQGHHERALKYAQGEGASTYMLIKLTEGFVEMRKKREEVTSEVIDNARDKGLEYLKERFDYGKDSYRFVRSLEETWFGSQGQDLLFGLFTARIKERLTRESYLKELQESQKFVDNKWAEKAERVEKDEKLDEILAIREKTYRGVVQKHLEGFGTAALDHGDVKTAVDAFIEGGLIKNPEIAQKIIDKMKELIQSKDPEIRAKALAARKSLEEYLEEDKEDKEDKENKENKENKEKE